MVLIFVTCVPIVVLLYYCYILLYYMHIFTEITVVKISRIFLKRHMNIQYTIFSLNSAAVSRILYVSLVHSFVIQAVLVSTLDIMAGIVLCICIFFKNNILFLL